MFVFGEGLKFVLVRGWTDDGRFLSVAFQEGFGHWDGSKAQALKKFGAEYSLLICRIT